MSDTKTNINRGQIAALLVAEAGWSAVTPAANTFSDAATDDMLRLVAKGAMVGSGAANASGSMSREEFFLLLAKVAGVEGKPSNPSIYKFKDVDAISPIALPIFSQLFTFGILTGYVDAKGVYTFLPAQAITQEEVQEALDRKYHKVMAPAGTTMTPLSAPYLTKNFNRFGKMDPSLEMYVNNYLMWEEPFKIIGNIYFIGNTWCSSYLIDTGDGLILLDDPCFPEFWLWMLAIRRLGFDPMDIKYIILSHAHGDHYGCVKPLLTMNPRIKTFVGDVDAPALINGLKSNNYDKSNFKPANQGFVPDVQIKDGEYIELGNTRIKCVLTPGHTVGVQSHFWTVNDGGKTYRIGLYGGAGFSSMAGHRLKARGMSDAEVAAYQQVFSDSIDKVWDEPVDVMLGNHPFHADLFEKNERVQRGEKGAFIDPSEWKRFLQELRDCYKEFLKLDEAGVNDMYKYSYLMIFRDKSLGQHEWPYEEVVR